MKSITRKKIATGITGKLLSITAFASLATLPTASMAYEAGDWIVRGGAAIVEPDESSSKVKVNGTGLANTGVGVDNDTQLGLTITYMLTNHIAVELLASTPFEHDVVMRGNGLSGFGVDAGTKIASVKHLPPTLSLQYFFMDANSAWQPYAGAGINYWLVLDEELSSAAETALAADNLNVDDSVGLALQLGMDYRISENWLVNAAVWNIAIDTEADFDTAVGKASADIEIDPWVYMVSVGYTF